MLRIGVASGGGHSRLRRENVMSNGLFRTGMASRIAALGVLIAPAMAVADNHIINQDVDKKGGAEVCGDVQPEATFNITEDFSDEGVCAASDVAVGKASFIGHDSIANYGFLGIGTVPKNQKGAATGVRGDTTVAAGNFTGQVGGATGDLGLSSAFFLAARFMGVNGSAAPASMSSFDNAATSASYANGGHFTVNTPTAGVAIGNPGGYSWIAGVYALLTGLYNNPPKEDGTRSHGAVAAIIGIDNASIKSAAPHYAAYLDGLVRVDAPKSNLPPSKSMNVVVWDAPTGVLHTNTACCEGPAAANAYTDGQIKMVYAAMAADENNDHAELANLQAQINKLSARLTACGCQ